MWNESFNLPRSSHTYSTPRSMHLKTWLRLEKEQRLPVDAHRTSSIEAWRQLRVCMKIIGQVLRWGLAWDFEVDEPAILSAEFPWDHYVCFGDGDLGTGFLTEVEREVILGYWIPNRVCHKNGYTVYEQQARAPDTYFIRELSAVTFISHLRHRLSRLEFRAPVSKE